MSIVLRGRRTGKFLSVIPVFMYEVDAGEYIIRSYTPFKSHFLLLYEGNFRYKLVVSWQYSLPKTMIGF